MFGITWSLAGNLQEKPAAQRPQHPNVEGTLLENPAENPAEKPIQRRRHLYHNHTLGKIEGRSDMTPRF